MWTKDLVSYLPASHSFLCDCIVAAVTRLSSRTSGLSSVLWSLTVCSGSRGKQPSSVYGSDGILDPCFVSVHFVHLCTVAKQLQWIFNVNFEWHFFPLVCRLEDHNGKNMNKRCIIVSLKPHWNISTALGIQLSHVLCDQLYVLSCSVYFSGNTC